MVKVSTSDILAVLRRFKRATDEDSPKSINYTKTFKPYQETMLIDFRYYKQRYVVIFDSKATDDVADLLKLVKIANPNITGELVKSPLDSAKAYGIPFKGHDCYLFEAISLKHRLDVELTSRYPQFSRSTLQKYIKLGSVQVDGDIQTSPKFEVSDLSAIAVNFPEKIDYSTDELPILYLDDNVIVINKPTGVLTHAKGELNDEFTVAEFFRRYTTFGLDTNRPGIVHRLDRDTSGVIIGARNPETAVLLQKQFADRKTKKTYIAVVDGRPKIDKALIDLPIGRNPSSPSTFRVDASGKAAETAYDVIDVDDKLSLVRLAPRTGRTHQLRVHMAYIGTPIHGDRVYGKTADRLYLHAHSLEITIPTSERKVFTAPLPLEFKQLFPDYKDAD